MRFNKTTKFISILFFLVLFYGLNSCTKSKNLENIHPTKENIEIATGINNTIDKQFPNYQENRIQDLSLKILDHKEIFQVGTTEGQSHEMIGSLIDAVFDSENHNLYLLDVQNMSLNIYDSNGVYLSKFGRQGRGPGEFVNPNSIIFDNGKIYLLNKSFNIQMFKEEENGFSFEATILDDGTAPDDFCIDQDHLFINTLPVKDPNTMMNNKNIISLTLDDPTIVQNKFGRMYRSDYWGTTMILSMGGIECGSNTGTIVQYMRHLNLLYGFNSQGDLIWTTKLGTFEFLEFLEKDGILGPNPESGQENFDVIENVVSINESFFLVQVANRELQNNGSINHIST